MDRDRGTPRGITLPHHPGIRVRTTAVREFTIRRRTRMYCIAVSLVLALLIGLTRVYLGVHYPTDVLAGWSAGLAWALLWWLIARSLQYRGQVKASG